MTALSRRTWLTRTTGALAIGATAPRSWAARALQDQPAAAALELRFAVKIGMVSGPETLQGKFALVKELGYDGIELDSPSGLTVDAVKAASLATELPVHGVVDSIHWNKRLSHPDEAVREEGIAGLERAVRDAHGFGGDSVLLVPGRVAGENETQEQVWERSIAGIRRVLPVARELQIKILIENVWNGFCYDHGGGADQSAQQLADYIDAIGEEADDAALLGSYFDIGNHRKYGKPEEWIRTLGKRIKKLDVKDWGVENGWAKIGDGDVDWAAVRKALVEIGLAAGTWATAEVSGGGRDRLLEIKERMDAQLRA